MTDKTTALHSVQTIINETLAILQLIEDIPRSDASFLDYQTICRDMPGQISTGRLKIAVVGVIKSGKSTFINSLVGKELVKRGAGVITSITTRIQKGKKNQASLYFRSWDDINFQLQKALLLFPVEESEKKISENFDIRRKKDREYLKRIYHVLSNDFPVTDDGIHPETLLIRYALKGYDTCKNLVKSDETVICFNSKEIDKHKDYTSDPNKAFYIKDVCLDVFGKVIDPNIEIADCQGADSTDPAQLAQIFSYLESSNLIIYCISSRTGLRQSDIRFLKRIKNLGLLDNIIFINNCDLTEHDNLDDLIKIENSIRDDLEFLEIKPEVFSFSSLYNLFSKLETKLSKKDLQRLRQWQEEKKMVQYSDLKTKEFNLLFKKNIDTNRYELLISNHLKRLGIIISQLDHRTDIFLNLLSSDRIKEDQAVKKLEHLHHNASRLESIVANSIQGAVKGLKDEIESNLKEIFNRDQNGILKKTRDYVRTVDIDIEKYRSTSKEAGFNQILYLLFQEFKRKLDLYVIDNVTPELKQIVQTQEIRIISYFQSLLDSYQIDLLKIDDDSLFKDVSKFANQQSDSFDLVDIEKIRKIMGLQIPGSIFEAKYTSRIKANVFAGFGLQTLSQIFASLFDKKSSFSFSPGLQKAVVKIKKKNQKLLKKQFEDFHIGLQKNYFLPLIEAATRDFKEKIDERFNRYHSFEEEIEHVFSLKHSEKQEQKKKVLFIKLKIEKLTDTLFSC